MKYIKFPLCLFMVISLALPVYAQNPGGSETSKLSGPRKQLATIIFSGFAGAILGLSTLSFYGRPQERLSNIAIGFAVGVIAGTVYVTYSAATQPQEYFGVPEGAQLLDLPDNYQLQQPPGRLTLRYDF